MAKKSEKQNRQGEGGGRGNKKAVDWNWAGRLAKLHCTKEEIARTLEMDDKTLLARCKEDHGCTFEEWIEQFKTSWKVSLRRAQRKSALGGNVTMQIFLGKNDLGQTDKQDHNFSGSFTVNIPKDDAKL